MLNVICSVKKVNPYWLWLRIYLVTDAKCNLPHDGLNMDELSAVYLAGISRKTACVSLRVGLLQSCAPPTRPRPLHTPLPPMGNLPAHRRGSRHTRRGHEAFFLTDTNPPHNWHKSPVLAVNAKFATVLDPVQASSGVWGAADEAVLKNVFKKIKRKKNPSF